MDYRTWQSKNRYLFILAAIWCLSLFNFYFPSFNNIFDKVGRQGFLLHSLLLFLSLASILFVLKAKLSKSVSIYLLIFTIMSCDILFTAFLSDELSIRDLFELFRPALFFATLWFGYEVARIFKDPENKVLNAILMPVIAMTVLALILYFSPRDLRSAIWGFYNKPSLIASNRLAGTFVNPYDFVLLVSVVLTYAYLKFIEEGYIRHILLGFLCCGAIILSQSKIGFVLILMSIFVTNLCMLNILLNRKNDSQWVWLRFFILPVFITLFIALAFIYYSDQIAYLVNGISRLLDGGDKSTQIRAEQIRIGLEIWSSNITNIIFGAGAMKSAGMNFENLYILYLVRYGLIGVILIAFVAIAPLVISFRLWQRKSSIERTLILMFFVLSAIAGISNNNIDQMRISFVYYMLVGVILSMANLDKPSVDH